MKPRILFVDDEPQALEGLKRMLSCMNDDWEMIFASGVDEALIHAVVGSCDGIVSDLRMPGKNGFELLAELRGSEQARDIPLEARIVDPS